MERRLGDILPTRRDVLKWSGLALAGTWIDHVVWPMKVQAAGKANPRATARNCILIQLGGGISQVDCWDFKESRFTPKDLDMKKISSDLSISRTLFPQMSDQMHRVALVRSMRAPEIVHFNGQYHTQTGRALNPGIAKEIPAFGSIISYELESKRRESDTFPTYVSTSLASANAGSIGAGFLPPKCTALDLDAATVFDTFGGDSQGMNDLLETRWKQLQAFVDEVSGARRLSFGSKAAEYISFYQDAFRILTDSRWSQAFKATEEEKKKYGSDEFGLGCILARNLIAADAGTRFVYINDGNKWDHHVDIFGHNGQSNHYFTCARLDKGLASLLDDLSAMPGKTAGKTLLDETMVVVTSEFGRNPQMNAVMGRDHYNQAYTILLAGGGVKAGRIIGKTDEAGNVVVETGWKHKQQPYMDNIVASIYSALGVDWLKRVENTPSGRAYEYVETAPLGASEFISNDEIAELFV